MVLAEETDWSHLEPEPLVGLAKVHDSHVRQWELLQAGRAHLQHRSAGALSCLQEERWDKGWGHRGHQGQPLSLSHFCCC